MDKYKELRELAGKATPGSWMARKNGEIGTICKDDTQSYGMMLVVARIDRYDHAEYEANAGYIAAASPEAIRALLGERDALVEAAMRTRTIVSEAAITGFNYKDGDWAERLFKNQAILSRAIEAAKRQEGV